VIGNHGAEPVAPAHGRPIRRPLATLRERIAGPQPNSRERRVIEDKGLRSRALTGWHATVGAALGAITTPARGSRSALREFSGKCVINIVAAQAPDKADAMFDLVARTGCTAAMFVGDDVNDE